MSGRITRRAFVGGALALATGTVLGACSLVRPPQATSQPSAPQPSTRTGVRVFRNARVLTMDATAPTADAVAIDGDDILAVGPEAAVLAAAGPGAEVADLGGRVLLPGFNDAHCHRIGDRAIAGFASDEDAIDSAIAGGWTSISEMFVDQGRLDLRTLDDAGRLRLRVNAYLPANYLEDKFGIWFGDYEPHQVFGPRLRIGGVKLFADRARPDLMLLSEPHLDARGRGDVYWSADEFTGLVREPHDDGWQVATHTCGDAAHDLVLDAYEAALAGADNAAHRHRVEHALVIRDDQVRRMSERSIIASIQLPFMSSDWAAWEEATLGPARLGWAGRWKDLLEAGVPMVGGTDFPWAIRDELNGHSGPAMRALSDGVTRVGVEAGPPPAWLAGQAVTLEQGLDLITRAGAYATFEEDRKGTVTPGKVADLVVLDGDPRSVVPADVAGVKVALTMIGGRVEYRDPSATGLPEKGS